MKKHITLFSLLTLNAINGVAQCNCSIPMQTFPSTANGITVSLASSGDVTQWTGSSNISGDPNGTWRNCGIISGPNQVGQTINAFSQVFSFSQPVNNICVVLSAVDSTENFSFSTNAGILSTYLCTEGCPNFTQAGNTFICTNICNVTVSQLPTLVPNPMFIEATGAIIQLNSTTAFTSFTVSGTGGNPNLAALNGSLLGLCVESLNTSVVDNEWQPQQVNVFPNPANKDVTVSIQHPINSEYKIKITDMFGNIVSANSYHNANNFFNQTVSTNELSNGLYLIEISSSHYSSVYKTKLMIDK